MKQNRRSKCKVQQRAFVQISIMNLTTQAANTSTAMNYINVAYDQLPYNMALATVTTESNS